MGVSQEKIAKLITNIEAEKVIDNPSGNKGLFYLKDGDVYIGIDNTTCDAWTEEFGTKDECMEWLIDETKEVFN